MLYNVIFATALLLSILCVNSTAKAQTVTFNTNVGEIVVELLPDEAPISVENFLGYVERGDYDGVIFHRSVADFVVQGGLARNDNSDPLQPPALSPVPLQPPIPNEFGRSNLRGTVAYARQGGVVDSATSQFFFNVTDNVFLDTVDQGFTVFGQVVSGMPVVDAINDLQIINAGSPFNELPVQASFVAPSILTADLIVINSATIEPLLGDVNLDGEVNFLDITPFISILSVNDFLEEADANGDGEVNFLDIVPFIALLSS